MVRRLNQTRDSLEFVKEVVQYEYFPNMRKFTRTEDENGVKRKRRFRSIFPIRRRSQNSVPLDDIMEYEVTESSDFSADTHETTASNASNSTQIQSSSRKGYDQALDVLSRALLLVLPAALLAILHSRYHRKQQVIIQKRGVKRRRRSVPSTTSMLRRRRVSKVAVVGPLPTNDQRRNRTNKRNNTYP